MDGKHDDYYEEQKQQRTAEAQVVRGCGRACYQTALCHHADGGTGGEAGADGEAGKELCLSSELGAVGEEGRRLPVKDKQREGEERGTAQEKVKIKS